MNGCPNNQLPAENCYPNTTFAVIPSYGGDGYYCADGNCTGTQESTVGGYRTLGNYSGQGNNCCNPQITPLCHDPNTHRSRPVPVRSRPLLGAKEQHKCANGKTFMCSGGTLGCTDNSPQYCGGSRPR